MRDDWLREIRLRLAYNRTVGSISSIRRMFRSARSLVNQQVDHNIKMVDEIKVLLK